MEWNRRSALGSGISSSGLAELAISRAKEVRIGTLHSEEECADSAAVASGPPVWNEWSEQAASDSDANDAVAADWLERA